MILHNFGASSIETMRKPKSKKRVGKIFNNNSMNIPLIPRWASSALQLSNTSYIDCGTPTVLSNLSSFTLEAWVYATSNSGFQSITGNVDNAIGGQYQLFLSDGCPVAYVGIAPYVIQSSQPISLNTWHHLASTFDGPTNTLTLFVDGNQVAQNIFSGNLPANGTNVLIGAVMQQNSPLSFFQGQIGRIAIWNSCRDAESILNDSVQVNVYKATENPDLVFYSDFSSMPSKDRSGNSVPMNFRNNPQYSFNVPCLVLGATGYADCGSFSDYSFPNNTPYTIEGWFFPTTESNGTIVSYGNALGQWEYKLLYQNNQLIALRNTDSQQIASSNSVMPTLSYYHFAVTYDSSVNALSLYINGNLQAVEYFNSPITSVTNGRVLIGAQYNSSGSIVNFLNATIQNLRIWNVCLEQSEISQWMYNDPISDTRLVSNFDFSVNPPIDSTDNTELTILGGAVQTLQQINIPLTEPITQLGVAQPINASYVNQFVETPTPPPVDVVFAEQPPLFSQTHKESSWSDFTSHYQASESLDKDGRLRKLFEISYAKADKMMKENPKLSQVFTRTDANGMTRIVHHGTRGDTLVYEGAIGEVSDCTLWWIQFIFQLTVGFFQALGLLPSTGDIATRVYNLIRANQTVMNALTTLTGKTITATAAISLMGVIYQQGLMWTIIKFVLTSAGWFALFWILRKVIAIVTGLEAAAILAGFVVWASQLTILSLKFNSNCGNSLQTVTTK